MSLDFSISFSDPRSMECKSSKGQAKHLLTWNVHQTCLPRTLPLLSETRFPGEDGIKEVGYMYFWKGKDANELPNQGVGLAIKTKLVLPSNVQAEIWLLQNERLRNIPSLPRSSWSTSEEKAERISFTKWLEQSTWRCCRGDHQLISQNQDWKQWRNQTSDPQ